MIKRVHTGRQAFRFRTRQAVLLTAAVAGGLGAQALGVEIETWIGPPNGSWTDFANWSGGNVPNGNSFDVRIDDRASVNSIVSLNTTVGVASLTLDKDDQ